MSRVKRSEHLKLENENLDFPDQAPSVKSHQHQRAHNPIVGGLAKIEYLPFIYCSQTL